MKKKEDIMESLRTQLHKPASDFVFDPIEPYAWSTAIELLADIRDILEAMKNELVEISLK